MNLWAKIGREMQKNGSDSVKLAERPTPSGQVGLFDDHRQSGRLRRFAGALHADGRKINGCDAKTLSGEPDAVAAIAISGNKNLAARGQTMSLRAQISVRLFAVHWLGLREAFVPHLLRTCPLVVVHDSSPQYLIPESFQNGRGRALGETGEGSVSDYATQELAPLLRLSADCNVISQHLFG